MVATVTSAAWWKAALIRAVRTALVIAVPYVGGGVIAHVPWLAAASAAGLGFILSLLTSLVGLPELAGKVPVWLALLERVTKTIAQSLLTGIGTVALFQSVDWTTALQAALLAGLGSLLLGVLGFLPESTNTAQQFNYYFQDPVDTNPPKHAAEPVAVKP